MDTVFFVSLRQKRLRFRKQIVDSDLSINQFHLHLLGNSAMRPVIRWYLSLSAVCLFGFAFLCALQPASSWAKEDEDDKVHDLMEKTHEGKNSTWKKGAAAAKKNPVDWATIKMALPRLEAMSKALQGAKNKEVRDTADSYVVAVKDISKTLAKQDAAGVREAFVALSNSCADCHYKGGPGGKLD